MNEALKLTKRGLYWLKVNIASEYGHDKLSFDEQVSWVNSQSIEELTRLEQSADNVFGYFCALNAYKDHLANQEVHYIMPVDSSNQALQLYGILAGCKKTASLGSIGTGLTRIDAYQLLADEMNKQFSTQLFTRKNCKKPLMTTLYGSTKGGESLHELLGDKLDKSVKEFDDAFTNSMLIIAPEAMNVMARLQELNDKSVGTYNWTLPDGAKVKYDVKSRLDMNIQKKSRSGKTFSCNLTSEVYAPSEFNKGMAPNIIHSVDGYLLRQIVRGMEHLFITTIHDSFSVHPNNVDKLRQVYEDSLIDILNSNLLEDIMTQIAGTQITFNKTNTLTEDDIRNSVYSLS
ncbi:MAG: hypothetical protein GQ570_08540 [Helicobacteraceae bacterium]|nr:hypothetical protein [Helicobacteraceae bacterium]